MLYGSKRTLEILALSRLEIIVFEWEVSLPKQLTIAIRASHAAYARHGPVFFLRMFLNHKVLR